MERKCNSYEQANLFDSSGQCVGRVVQIEDSEFEIFVVPIAVGVALEGSDLTIDRFELSSADSVFVPVQDKWLPYREHPGSVFEYSDSAGGCFLNPGLQFRRSSVSICTLKQ